MSLNNNIFLNIIFHIVFTLLISYNFVYYCLDIFGIRLTVIYYMFFLFLSLLILFFYTRKLDFSFYNNRWLIIFLSVVLLSCLFNNNSSSFDKLLVLLTRAIIPLFILQYFINFGFKLNINYIFILGIIISLIVIYNSFTIDNFSNRASINFYKSAQTTELYGVIEDSRSLLIILMLILFYFKNVYIKYFGILIFLSGILATQTRQTSLALILIIVPYFLYKTGYRFIFYLLLIFIISSIFIITFSNSFYDIFSLRIFNLSDSYFYVDSRQYLFFWALDLFSQSPILGNGFAYTDYINTYPHNIVVELLAEIGIIGFLIFMIFTFTNFMSVKDNNFRLILVVILFFCLFSGSLSQNFLLLSFLVLNNKLIKYG